MTMDAYITVCEVLKQEGWKLTHFRPPYSSVWLLAKKEIVVPFTIEPEERNNKLKEAGITNRRFEL